MQKAAFLDLDHTLYKGYVFQEWMEYLLLKGFKKSPLVKLDLKLFLNKVFGFINKLLSFVAYCIVTNTVKILKSKIIIITEIICMII